MIQVSLIPIMCYNIQSPIEFLRLSYNLKILSPLHDITYQSQKKISSNTCHKTQKKSIFMPKKCLNIIYFLTIIYLFIFIIKKSV